MNCALKAFSAAFECDPEGLTKIIGHCGTEKFWDLPEPHCFRSFTIPEMVFAGLKLGYAVITVEATVDIAPDQVVDTFSFRYRGEPPMVCIGEGHAWYVDENAFGWGECRGSIDQYCMIRRLSCT